MIMFLLFEPYTVLSLDFVIIPTEAHFTAMDEPPAGSRDDRQASDVSVLDFRRNVTADDLSHRDAGSYFNDLNYGVTKAEATSFACACTFTGQPHTG